MYCTVAPLVAVLWFSLQFVFSSGAKDPIRPTGGCVNPATISSVVGFGKRPGSGGKVVDNNLRTKWVEFGVGKSLWLELARPTVINSVAIAFRKGRKRAHNFSIFLVTTENQAELVFEGAGSGKTNKFQTFSLGDKAQKAVALSIVGDGNDKNKWNGYAEVQLCSSEDDIPANADGPTFGVTANVDVDLQFPEGRRGFNIVNECSFPIRVGSTGNQAACEEGTATNPSSGNCFWSLPGGKAGQGKRDLEPGQAEQYLLPELGPKEGSIIWAGNIWASTGCTSEISGGYDFPTTENCVTNYCQEGGVCPDYLGPSGVVSKAEFALQRDNLDFYDVSVIDGANIPMEIVPINPPFNENDHFCGTPGLTAVSGALQACSWEFSPESLEGFLDEDLSPFTRVVWPQDPDLATSCIEDTQCAEAGPGNLCGVYEERTNAGIAKTGNIVPHVCGRPVGWIGAQTSCDTHPKEGGSYPNDHPYNCQRVARHGSFKELYRCAGSVYGSEACYLIGAKDSCCGCPPWDQETGGCVSVNPDWTQNALPWAKFFKSACPTAYSFPRDDRTSMFVCSNMDEASDPSTSKNTQSYTIRFCPGDSEEKFYK